MNKKLTFTLRPGSVIIGLIFSILLVTCREFRDFNSLANLKSSQELLKALAMVVLVTLGTSFALSLAALLIPAFSNAGKSKRTDESTLLFFGVWVFLMIAYTPWLIGNFPGSTNPDGEYQLATFLGDHEWSNWQPVVSTLLMGGCYSLGNAMGSPNFGFFLYQLLQTLGASAIYAFSMMKLRKFGVRIWYILAGTLFFGLVPLFGGFSQWVEKGYLFAVFMLLQAVLSAEILFDDEVDKKKLVVLGIVSLAVAFLRNNGIHAIIPGLAVLGLVVKKENKKKILGLALVVILAFEAVTRGLYPVLNIGKGSISETIGFMFQQTARYVNNYEQDLTDEEIAILTQNFQRMEVFKGYNPTINDPVKIYYNHSDPSGYFKIWFTMFFKHPDAYFGAYFNGAYGYLAPVKADAGAYFNETYNDFMTNRLGLSHHVSARLQRFVIDTLNTSSYRPVLKYINRPGLYTWIIVSLVYLLFACKKKKYAAPMVPFIMTILVCTVSPLACAMRYAIPMVCATPFLIGWTAAVLRRQK